MLFENYEDWRVYPPQPRIYFPKNSSKNKTAGYGSALFLLTPKTTSSFEFMKDKNVALRMSLYKYYMIETMYKEKIGRKNVILNMTRQMEALYNENNVEKDTTISYIPRPQKKARLKSGNNIIVDLSMWMELYLKYTVTIQNPKEKCRIFIDLLDKLLNDSNYNNYEKLVCIDINSWTNRAADCVMMNRDLLNNPLSILIYAMVKYPDLLNGKLKNFRIYLVNRSSKQIFLFNTKDLIKDNYNKFKSKIKLFKGISISSSETLEGDTNISEGEAKAIAINNYKNKVLKSMKSNLLGNNKNTEIREIIDDDELIDSNDDYDEIFDVTKEIEEESDEVKPTDEDSNLFDEMGADLDLDAEALAELDNMIGDVDDVSTDDILNTPVDEVADDLAERVKNNVFIAEFKPKRTSEQEERNREMMDIQAIALNQENIDNAKTKIIDTTDFSDYINSSNVNILKSKYVNFDKDYVEKKMEGDIDNAVACLSGATDKIFITNKEVIDSSDSLNLKRTLKYSLEDEKGNKMTITFDVPIIIDNCYIYVNGSKKLIGHQFILKPLVKTGPDTVQLVTSYNKVFITRDGVVDYISSSIITYMEKNPEKFKCVRGNSSIKNKKYNTALDFTMYAKLFTRFTIGDEEFITGIEEFYDRYNKKYPTKKLKLDKKKIAEKYPISFNKKTGEIRYMKSTESFSDILLSIIDEEDKKAISRIKKKPRLVYVRAKLMGQIFPMALLLMYHEGFASIMKRADIAYQFTDKKSYNKMDKMRYDFLELSDGLVVWERRNMLTSLLMNGLKRLDFTPYTIEELESKDTYRSLLVDLYNGDNSISYKIDQFYDFTIDSITKEILEDMNYPTNLPDLLILAVKMLCDSAYALENNMNNMRIRSNEVIPAIIHKEIADAYNLYRKTSYKKKPVNVSIKPNIIIDKLLSADTNLIEEFSTINPVLEIEKARCVTFKGYRGIQLDRAITLPRRGYDPSMLGIMGISTSSDANCGVNRQMTLEPAITSTRGYLEVNGVENVNSLTDANLLSPAELLTPLGVIHDDPDRTAIKKSLLDVAV